MGLFSRLKTGWSLTKDSITVLRHNPELAVFPLVSGIAGILFLVLVLGGSYVLVGADSGPVQYAVLFLVYLGTTFIASFFTAALMHETREAFEGHDPSFGSGVAAAWENKAPLFAWATVAATVGVVIRIVQSQDHPVARLLAGVFSVAWSILTYFVVPVIVFEEVGVRDAITRSGETFKRTWGETAGVSFGVGFITFVFVAIGVLIAVGLLALGASSGSAVGFFTALAVGLTVVILTYLFGVTLGGIARTALYVYATDGTKPGEFDNVDFQRIP